MTHTERLDYKGWTIEVQRKAFRRNLSIVLKPGQPVQVRAARLTPLVTILQFVESRQGWIEKTLRKFSEQEKQLPARELKAGNMYPLYGIPRRLTVSLTPLNQVFFSAHEEELILHLPKHLYKENLSDLSFAHEALREFYRLRAEKLFEERMPYWMAQTGLRPSRWKVRETRTRWGSCHPNGTITLNWRLSVYPKEVVDYVIVHELCHLQQMNHSKAFWNLVEKSIPDCDQWIRYLKDHHRLSDFLEKA